MSRIYFEMRYNFGRGRDLNIMPTPEEIKKQIEADNAKGAPLEPSKEEVSPMPPKPTATQASKQEERIDFSKAIDNVANVEAHVLGFKGKPGMNPFMFIRDRIDPLRSSYDRGDRSRELFNQMMALKKVEPIAPKREPKRGIGGERKV